MSRLGQILGCLVILMMITSVVVDGWPLSSLWKTLNNDRGVCYNGGIYDPLSGKCNNCKVDCAAYGYGYLDDCQCICDPCEGAHQFPNCTCSAQCGASCPPSQVFNEDCECACPITTPPCPHTNQQYDANCNCYCPLNNDHCPGMHHLDAGTCQCACNVAQDCPNPAHQIDAADCTCKCDLNIQCNHPHMLDENSCTCVCPSQGECGNLKVRNTSTCECECAVVEDCQPYYQWSGEICHCECNTATQCEAGSSFDQSACTCVPDVPPEYTLRCQFDEEHRGYLDPSTFPVIEAFIGEDNSELLVYASCDDALYTDHADCTNSRCGETCSISKPTVCVDVNHKTIAADPALCEEQDGGEGADGGMTQPLTRTVTKQCDWECNVAVPPSAPSTMELSDVSSSPSSSSPLHITTTSAEFPEAHSCHTLTPPTPCTATCLECPFLVNVRCASYIDMRAGQEVASPVNSGDGTHPPHIVGLFGPSEYCAASGAALPPPPSSSGELILRAPCPCGQDATTSPINHGDTCEVSPKIGEARFQTLITPPPAASPTPEGGDGDDGDGDSGTASPLVFHSLGVYQRQAGEHILIGWSYYGSYLNQFMVYLIADDPTAFLPLPPRVLVGSVDAVQRRLVLAIDTLTPFTHQLDGVRIELVLAGSGDSDDNNEHHYVVGTSQPFTILSRCHTVDKVCPTSPNLWNPSHEAHPAVVAEYTQCRLAIDVAASAEDGGDEIVPTSRCQADGVCAATTGECTCDTTTGHVGVFCELSPCDQLGCLADGVADVDAPCRYASTADGNEENEDHSAPSCHCDEGISGDRCEHRDGCTLSCANGGRAGFHSEAERCQCTCNALRAVPTTTSAAGTAAAPLPPTTHWSGSTCTLCTMACLNGGTSNAQCSACVCPVGYVGARCAYPVWYNSVSISRLSSTLLDLVLSVTNGEAVSTLSTQKLRLLESMLLTALSADMTRQLEQDQARNGGGGHSSRGGYSYLPSISSLRVVKSTAPGGGAGGDSAGDVYRLQVTIMMAPVEYYDELNGGNTSGGDTTFVPIPGGYTNTMTRYNTLFDDFIRSHLGGEIDDEIVVEDPLCLTIECKEHQIDGGDDSSNSAVHPAWAVISPLVMTMMTLLLMAIVCFT